MQLKIKCDENIKTVCIGYPVDMCKLDYNSVIRTKTTVCTTEKCEVENRKI